MNTNIAVSIAALLSLTACGNNPVVTPLVVGSKESTAQIIIGEIIAQHLERRLQHPVERRLALGSSKAAHQALIAGHVDLYLEDIGAARAAIFHFEAQAEPAMLKARIESEYRKNQLEFLAPLGFSNKWILAVTREFANSNKIATLSQASAYRKGWQMATTTEFLNREDGLAALQTNYSLGWSAAPRRSDEGVTTYGMVNKGQCNLIGGAASDAALLSKDYQILEDDRRAFQVYDEGVVVRAEKLVEFPGLRKALEELSGIFDIDTVRRLAAAVDNDQRPFAAVAAEFIQRH